jgi:hypothetical protein
VQQSIDRELKTDIQNIVKAGEHMKNSAASIMNKPVNAHSRGRKQVEYAREASSSSLPAGNNYFEVLFAASGIVASVVRRGPIEATRSGSDGGGDLRKEAQQQKYQECLSEASEKHGSCRTRCAAGLFQWLCLANCDASYMITKAGCLAIIIS